MKPAAKWALEFCNRYCIPTGKEPGEIEWFFKSIQDDAIKPEPPSPQPEPRQG